MSTSIIDGNRQIRGLAFSRSGVLALQVLSAQVAGVLMIAGPSLFMGGPFRLHAIAALPVALFTIVYFSVAYCPWQRRTDSVAILNRMRSMLGALVAIDVLIVLGLVGLSGGLAKSHLTFVLALIPPILALVRGGGATVIGICFLTILAVATDLAFALFPTMNFGASALMSGVLHKTMNLQSADPQLLTVYPFATSFGILCGVALAFVQSYLVSGDTLPEDAFHRMVVRHQNGLDEPRSQKRLMAVLARSYHKVSRIVSLTNHGDIHCSLVHPIDDLLFESYALCLPAYIKRGPTGAQLMANMVFAIHWLDDLFDGLGYHAILDGEDGSAPLDLSKMKVSDIARRFRPHGVKRVVELINCRLSPLQRLSFAKPSWDAGIESGLMRVVLGGIIQNSRTADRRTEAIERLRHDVRELVEDEGLNSMLGTASPVFLWSISKTDMPLVLGMFASPSDTKSIGSLSLLLDATLMPFLLWHDLGEEVQRESVGIRRFHQNKSLLDDVDCAVQEATAILDAKGHILLESPIWKVMKPVVKHVSAEFDSRLLDTSMYHDFKARIATMCQQDK